MENFIINGIEYKFFIKNGGLNSDLEICFNYPGDMIYWRDIINKKIEWTRYDFLYGFCKNHSEAANYLDKYVKNIAFV